MTRKRCAWFVLCCFSLFALACGGGKKSNSSTDSTGDSSGTEDVTTSDTSDDAGDLEPDTADEETPTIPCVDVNGNLIAQACPPSTFCGKEGLCLRSREAGERCDGLAHTSLTNDSACKVGLCKPGPFDGASYCVNIAETCGLLGEPASIGSYGCSDDGSKARLCGNDGNWSTPENCTNVSCDGGEGKIVVTCVSGEGCKPGTTCDSCFPGRFDGTTNDCATFCTGPADCAPGAECQTGTCVESTKKGPGSVCTSVADCQTGLFCVRAIDDAGNFVPSTTNPNTTRSVCCKEDCNANNGACRGCKSNGECGNVKAEVPDPLCPLAPPEGNQDRKPCRQNGQCDGLGNCSLWPAGTVCEAPSCTCNPPTSKDNCVVSAPGKCDAQSNCNKSQDTTPCPTGLGCNQAKTGCDFGTCTKHSPDCDLSGFEGKLFCNSASSCQPRIALLGSCYQLSYDSGKPYDDLVCENGLVCLKDNFDGNSGALCGDGTKCIAPDGKSQLDTGTIRCGADKTPWQCTTNVANANKREWTKLAPCKSEPAGCQFVNGDDNSGYRPGEVCQASLGCIDAGCIACPKNTRFDPTAKACLASCATDADCPSTYRCNSGSGTCVLAAKLGESCVADPNSASYKPCLAQQDGKPLYCTKNATGQSVCCLESCDGPCRYCKSTSPEGPPSYLCENRASDYLTQLCNSGTTTCGKQTGYCDGKGSCALPGASTVCDTTCSDGKLTTLLCDGQGHCTTQSQPQTCPNGCAADGKSCKNNGCNTHSDCQDGFYCTNQKLCAPRLTKGARCEAKSYKATQQPPENFDSAVCVSGLSCSRNPAGDKGYCTESGKCPVNETTFVDTGKFSCDAGQNKVYKCETNGSWSASSCMMSSSGCNPDTPPSQYKGYLAAATCTTNSGCVAPQGCTDCPKRVHYTQTPQPDYPTPCHYSCHCKPMQYTTLPPVSADDPCPAGYVFEPSDSKCWSGLWCGTDPNEPGSTYECRDKLPVGSRCSDTTNPTRQCSGSKCCAEDLGNGQKGDTFCSTCCSDSDCSDPSKYCDVRAGSCKSKLSTGTGCGRDGECQTGTCCNSLCSVCCNSYDPACNEDDKCCGSSVPWCNNGICEGAKLGGSSCSCDNGVSCDECKSKECINKVCGCNVDGDCQEGFYCANKQCLRKKNPGVQCGAGNQCTSGVCCGDGRCKGTCCSDGECGNGQYCDNNAKRHATYQPNDGVTYSCKLKRAKYFGCVADVQCSSGKCNSYVSSGRDGLDYRDGYYCAECQYDNQCSIIGTGGRVTGFGTCCGGYCLGALAKCQESLCASPTKFRCGKGCCDRATQYCSGGACVQRGNGGCALSDMWCVSNYCDRTSAHCLDTQ